jgi:hypothetical protein
MTAGMDTQRLGVGEFSKSAPLFPGACHPAERLLVKMLFHPNFGARLTPAALAGGLRRRASEVHGKTWIGP